MKRISIEDLFKKRKRDAIAVPTPEIEPGGCLYVLNPEDSDVRDLAEMQWVAFQKLTGTDGTVGFRKFLAAWFLADENNERLFDSGPDEQSIPDSFIETVNSVGKIPVPALCRVFDTVSKTIGLSKADEAELVKNSAPTRIAVGSGSKRLRKGKAANNGSVSLKTQEN